jgi:hypothetical protein
MQKQIFRNEGKLVCMHKLSFPHKNNLVLAPTEPFPRRGIIAAKCNGTKKGRVVLDTPFF